MQLMHNLVSTETIKKIRNLSDAEYNKRKAEDVVVLDTVIETQRLLQQMVLLHFGSKSDEIDLPKLEKLDSRMSEIIDRKTAREKMSSNGPTEEASKSEDLQVDESAKVPEQKPPQELPPATDPKAVLSKKNTTKPKK